MSDDSDYAGLVELIKQHYQERKKEKKEDILRILWCGRNDKGPWSEVHKYRKVIPNEKLPEYYEWEPMKGRGSDAENNQGQTRKDG